MKEAIERLLRRPAAAVIARVTLTFPFWWSGASKLIDFQAGVAEMARFGLEPAALFNVATVVVQLTGSLLVIAGRHVWLGAGVLGVFTGLTVLLVHHFWTMAEEPFRTIALIPRSSTSASSEVCWPSPFWRPGANPIANEHSSVCRRAAIWLAGTSSRHARRTPRTGSGSRRASPSTQRHNPDGVCLRWRCRSAISRDRR